MGKSDYDFYKVERELSFFCQFINYNAVNIYLFLNIKLLDLQLEYR